VPFGVSVSVAMVWLLFLVCCLVTDCLQDVDNSFILQRSLVA